MLHKRSVKTFAALRDGFVRRGIIGLFAAATLAMANHVHAQNAVDAGYLLMPFSQLDSTDEGKAVLAQNLSTVVEVQNSASPELQALAMHDFALDWNMATSIADGLGPAFVSAYFGAIYNSSPNVAPLTTLFLDAVGTAESGASFAKDFFGNGDTQDYSISFPANGHDDVYGKAYIPEGQTDPNPKKDPRPFQVVQYHPPDQIEQFSAPTFVIPTAGQQGPPVGAPMSNTEANHSVRHEASFPSGHTTYAHSSAILFGMMMPEGYQAMMNRADAFANGRLVMGAHYPIDVIGGRTLATYYIANWLSEPDNMAIFQAASTSLQALLAEGYTADTGPALWTYAGEEPARAEYLERMTYGLTPLGPTDRAMVVPENAHYLLATRFPYMSVAQQNEVLRTTAYASGGPLDNLDPAYKDWDRINLFDAAGGFGAIDTDTTITMDASAGGLNAADEWNNDIGGIGELTKEGTGILTLSGNNTFGGVHISNGAVNLTGTNTFSKATSVGGAGHTAVLNVSGATIGKTIDVKPLGVLNVSGTASANDDFQVHGGADKGIANLYVSGNNQLKAGIDGTGSFVNDGAVTLYTSPDLAAGNYTPIAAGSMSGSISGTGTIEAYGASWDSGTSTLVVGNATSVDIDHETHTGTITNENVNGKRYEFEHDGDPLFMVGFNSAAGTIEFSATELTLSTINGQAVLMAFDFDTTLASGEALLSYGIGSIANPALTLWHLADGETEWTLFTPDYANYDGTWYSFKTDGFSSYALTAAVPEPATWGILMFGGAVLAVSRRRSIRRPTPGL